MSQLRSARGARSRLSSLTAGAQPMLLLVLVFLCCSRPLSLALSPSLCLSFSPSCLSFLVCGVILATFALLRGVFLLAIVLVAYPAIKQIPVSALVGAARPFSKGQESTATTSNNAKQAWRWLSLPLLSLSLSFSLSLSLSLSVSLSLSFSLCLSLSLSLPFSLSLL